jgi:glycosyltransferase involved in cell wall biosynthesis
MRIGILLHPYGEKNPAGLGRTIFELTKAMIEGDPANEYIIYVKDKPEFLPAFNGNNWRLETLGGGDFWLDRGFRRVIKADIHIFNTPILPLFFVPRNSIVIALDFAYWFFPPKDFWGKIKNWLLFIYHGYSLWRAKHVIAISEATKRDVIKLFKIPEKRISIMYLGYKPICAEPQREVVLPDKFFLFVGIIKERKNVFNVVRAFREYRRTHDTHKLVIAGNGAGAYYDQIRKYVEDEGIGDSVIFFGHADDQQLSYMYRKAEALFFPSIAEGFGMPVAEAMDCGLPVITSNTTSLPEVGGDGAIIVDPYNIKEMAEALARISTDRFFREQLIQRGFEQKKKFGWDKSAQKLLEVIFRISNI